MTSSDPRGQTQTQLTKRGLNAKRA